MDSRSWSARTRNCQPISGGQSCDASSHDAHISFKVLGKSRMLNALTGLLPTIVTQTLDHWWCRMCSRSKTVSRSVGESHPLVYGKRRWFDSAKHTWHRLLQRAHHPVAEVIRLVQQNLALVFKQHPGLGMMVVKRARLVVHSVPTPRQPLCHESMACVCHLMHMHVSDKERMHSQICML